MTFDQIALYSTIFIPAVFGFVTAAFCNVGKDAGSVVKFRPPAWVFSIAWIILYICLGLSWFFSNKDKNSNKILVNIMFSAVVLALTGWLLVYACGKNKKGGIYMIVISILAALLAYTSTPNLTAKLLLFPLIVWLLFATLLNTFEVQTK